MVACPLLTYQRTALCCDDVGAKPQQVKRERRWRSDMKNGVCKPVNGRHGHGTPPDDGVWKQVNQRKQGGPTSPRGEQGGGARFARGRWREVRMRLACEWRRRGGPFRVTGAPLSPRERSSRRGSYIAAAGRLEGTPAPRAACSVERERERESNAGRDHRGETKSRVQE